MRLEKERCAMLGTGSLWRRNGDLSSVSRSCLYDAALRTSSPVNGRHSRCQTRAGGQGKRPDIRLNFLPTSDALRNSYYHFWAKLSCPHQMNLRPQSTKPTRPWNPEMPTQRDERIRISHDNAAPAATPIMLPVTHLHLVLRAVAAGHARRAGRVR